VAVLIGVSYGRLDGERRSAAKRSKLWCWSSVLGDQGHGEVEKMAAQGAVSRCGLGVPFIGYGRQYRGGEVASRVVMVVVVHFQCGGWLWEGRRGEWR
jgi:hypothetical protein